jgi:hypothetical protein
MILFGKPLHTFPDHAPAPKFAVNARVRNAAAQFLFGHQMIAE